MIDKGFIDKVNSIKKICAESKLPVSIEVDNTPDGIDGEIILGDIPFEKTGDVYDMDFNIITRFSAPKSKWKEFLKRLEILSQKLCRDTRHTFEGWSKEDDESKLIYSGLVIVKGIMNPDLLV